MYENNNDIWGTFKEGVLRDSEEVFGYKKNSKCNVNTWCWNSGAKDEMQQRRSMKEKAGRKINESGRNPNNVFRIVRKVKIGSIDVVGGWCMRGNDGTQYLNEKDRANLWKAYMSKIMIEDNELDQIADTNTMEGPIE